MRNSEGTFNAADALGLFSKYRGLFFTTTAICFVLGLAAAYALPNKYKAHFVLTIDAKYFQSPLTHDFIPEVNDPVELKSESASVLSRALTPDFLDSLGNKYGIYQSHASSFKIPAWLENILSQLTAFAQSHGISQPGKMRAYDPSAPREALLKHIDILDVNDTTFDISFKYVDPTVTYQAAQDLEAQVVRTLSEGRINNLVTLRDAIRKQLQWLSFNVSASTETTGTSERPQLINEELADVRAQIQALSARYTDQHPLVLELKSREQTLSRLLASSENRSASLSGRQSPVIGGETQDDVRAMTNDLLTKMNYLNIALESDKGHSGDYFAVLEPPVYPTGPTGPSKIIFALGGGVLGLLVSLFVAAIREYFDRSTLHAETLAQQLGIPLLGKLPSVPWKELKAGDRN